MDLNHKLQGHLKNLNQMLSVISSKMYLSSWLLFTHINNGFLFLELPITKVLKLWLILGNFSHFCFFFSKLQRNIYFSLDEPIAYYKYWWMLMNTVSLRLLRPFAFWYYDLLILAELIISDYNNKLFLSIDCLQYF